MTQRMPQPQSRLAGTPSTDGKREGLRHRILEGLPRELAEEAGERNAEGECRQHQPLPATADSRKPMKREGEAPRDLRLGSGLTANRKNLPYASELYLAFNVASRFSSTSALL
jgi:hypothetical protein